MALTVNFGKPPQENLEYLKSKGYRMSFHYSELSYEAHRRAFTAAKMMRYDLLVDVRKSLEEAQASGMGFKEWKQNIVPTLQKYGWWGQQDIVDPRTGEVKTINIGSRRIRTIFETNMRVSHEAARCKFQRNLPASTFWRYVSKLLPTTRESHSARHGVILPRDHPWWLKNRPLNGYGCVCTVTAHTKAQIKARGWTILDTAPDDIYDEGWGHSPCEYDGGPAAVWERKTLDAPDWIAQHASNDIDAFKQVDGAFTDAPADARAYVMANLHRLTLRIDDSVRNSHYIPDAREMVLRTDSALEYVPTTIRHETGHFVDDINGWFSTGNAFYTPLLQDAAGLKGKADEITAALSAQQNVMLDDLFYIASGGAVGERTRPDLKRTLADNGLPKESFADLWTLYVSDETGYNIAKRYFPRTAAAFEQLLAEILKEHR